MKAITKIRKEVAILANKINKKVHNLSDSFKRAWQIVRGKKLVSKVAGVSYGSRPKALARLASYSRHDINVMLEREADNKYDSNAIRVMVSVGNGDKYHLGFIPRDLAALLAPLIDKGIEIASRFVSVTGGVVEAFNYGALVVVEL